MKISTTAKFTFETSDVVSISFENRAEPSRAVVQIEQGSDTVWIPVDEFKDFLAAAEQWARELPQ